MNRFSKQYNRQTGKLGEDLAAGYLDEKGFKILMRNYSTRYGEIDLVCSHNNITIFVEVKTKKGDRFGRPEEMVNRNKLSKVKRMGILYLQGREVPCRIDVVAVELDEGGSLVSIRHYENVL